LFEGSPLQMNASLTRLRDLPPDTRVYCGHEYTAANLKFAGTVDPDNAAILQYRNTVDSLRGIDAPTLPSNLALESRVNPFLRCDDAAVHAAASRHAGRPLEGPVEVFAVLRSWKDGFR
jgi:hydroxyacylglutathione hydrolase